MRPNGDGAARRDQTPDLRLLVDSAPSLIHTGRPDGHLDFFNRTWLSYVGQPLEDLEGWKWTEFIHPEDVEGIVEKWRASLASGEPFLHEARVLRADGEYRWMLHHKVATRDPRGQIVKWYGSSIDIEDRKRAEEQLRRSTLELQRSEFYLAEGQRLAHMGSWAFNPAGFDYWSPELFRMHGLDPSRKAPTVQEYLDFVHPQDRESMADLINGLVAEATPFDATKRIVRPDGQVRYIRCVGVPAVGSRSLKKYVGSAIDVTEHELLTQELRRREAYLAEAQRLSHTGSFGYSPATRRTLYWSEELFRIFGLNPQRGIPDFDLTRQLVHPEDIDRVSESCLAGFLEKAEFSQDYRLVLHDGTLKHLHVIWHPVLDEAGDLVQYIGTAADVTERKRAEEKIRQSEQELRTIIETIPAFIGTNLPDGSTDFVSQSFLDYLGISREQWLDWGWLTATHPDDVAGAVEKFKAALAAGRPLEYEQRLRKSDGTYGWFWSRNVPLRDAGGKIVKWYGVLSDIEDRKSAEDKIRQQQTELRQILDLAPQIIAVYGPNREQLYANRVLLDYLGLTLEEWQQRFDRAGIAHPDEWDRVNRHFDRALTSGDAFELEMRLRKSDGSYRWFLARFNPLRDEHGQITRWYVTGTDIEDRKQAEDRLQRENIALREEIDKTSMFEEIVGASPALRTVLSRISKVAPSDSTVLITGETGTGKELVARAIHRRSNRASRAFVSVNCAAVPRDLIASELFGHEKGAFTGATQQRLGRFELANGGTLFLDEVGELPAETQIALLRVLQEHEFERVGGTRPIRADLRAIAATNRDLQAAISAGSFRSDLFYRLNVFPIEIPPLRERKEDIRLLVEYFIDRYARKAGKKITTVDKKTLRLLESYPWPGNIRELQNVIERSVIVCETENFSVDESWLSQQPSNGKTESQLYLSEKVAAQEKEIIEAALRESQGRVFGPSGAAAKLGIARSTLESKIRSLKINKNRFRAIPGT
jgi:PAS domain S-box-containing protein